MTYQADEDEDKLYKICVGHRVEASQKCVGDGYGCRDPNANPEGHIQNHTHGSSCQHSVSVLVQLMQITFAQHILSLIYFIKYNLPKPISVVGTQVRSRNMDIRLITAARTFPYLIWKGSIIVTKFLSLIGLANTKPPFIKGKNTSECYY